MSGPETSRDLALAIATGAEIVIFQLLVFYCTFRIVQNRSALHIAQRNLWFLLSTQLAISAANLAVMGRWFLLAMRWRFAYPAFLVYMRMTTCFSVTLLCDEALFKAYLLISKFKDAGTEVDEGLAAKFTRFIMRDIRTTRAQNRHLMAWYIGVMLCWIPTLTVGDSFCRQLCAHRELPLFGSTWFFPSVPMVVFVGPISNTIIQELVKLGEINESLGLSRELSAISKFSAGPMTLSLWWLIFMDFGVIPERLAWIGLFGFMTGIYSILWNSQLQLTSPYGYGLFSDKSKIAPAKRALFSRTLSVKAGNLLLIEQTTMNPLNVSEASASPVPSEGPSKLGHRRSSVDEVIITTDPNYELLQTLTTDPDIQNELYQAARTVLSEEMVRCAVAVSQLLKLPKAKEERENIRAAWIKIINDHIKDGSSYPISMDEGERAHLVHQVAIASRRRVLFNDDIDKVHTEFKQVLDKLIPQVKPILAVHYSPKSSRRSSEATPRTTPRRTEEAVARLTARLGPELEAVPEAKDMENTDEEPSQMSELKR